MSSIFDVFDNQAQTQAANAQTTGINAGYQQLANLYGQGQNALTTNYTAGLQPFLQNYGTATQGTTQLGNALGINGPAGSKQALQTLQATPGYNFQLQQGDNAINAAAAANGTGNSGNQQLALSNYNQGLAGTTYNNYVSQLQPYLGAASTAAGGIGSLYSGLGTGLNASNMQQGNAAYGAQSSIGNANANAALGNLTGSANLLGLGTGVLGLGANTVGGGMFNGLGSGLSSLFSLSDANAKEDIEPIGKLYDGQNVYRYRYKGDARPQIGLIAQEVEKARPDAVVDFDGVKFVDLHRATDYAADIMRMAA